MIKFYKAGYSRRELFSLHAALKAALRVFKCPDKEGKRCRGCDNRMACTDLYEFQSYVRKLIDSGEGSE